MTPPRQAGLSDARTKATATLISEKWIGPLDGKNGKEARGLAADIEQAITHYVRAELSAAYLDRDKYKDAYVKTSHEVEQALGRALGYPRYCDDQKNFPGSTDADGVCVGEHVPGSIADEAAQHIVAAHLDRDLAVAAVREQAAKVCDDADAAENPEMYGDDAVCASELANRIRNLPLPPSDSLAKVRELMEAVDWYKEKAEAISRYMPAKKADSMLAVVTELNLDAGKRGNDALASLEPLIGKPQT